MLRTFHDVTVYPTQEALRPPFVLFRGGPAWPFFWAQVRARHCRYRFPVPLDLPPRRGAVVAIETEGFWCGPVTQHFGHAIASFGARLATTAAVAGDVPLVFSSRPGEGPPPFFLPMLAHFGIGPGQARIVDRPTRFTRLSVLPQAERLLGGPPDDRYLDLLNAFAGPPPIADGSRVFVSRAGLDRGRLAGENYLEQAFAAAGWTVFRPELSPLADQLATYRRASTLVFSEGSALHALQLLGRLRAHVIVLARRRGRRLARAALAPRVRRLDYVDAVRAAIERRGRSGLIRGSAAIAQLDVPALLSALARHGVDLGRYWDHRAFVAAQNADLGVWVAAGQPEHVAAGATAAHPVSRTGWTGIDAMAT